MTHDEIEKKLQDRQAQLADRVARIAADLGSARPRDSQERATAQENDEVLERLDESEREELVAIRAALGRIAAGTYGGCTACGEPIDARRLEALPFTSTCITCAR